MPLTIPFCSILNHSVSIIAFTNFYLKDIYLKDMWLIHITSQAGATHSDTPESAASDAAAAVWGRPERLVTYAKSRVLIE